MADNNSITGSVVGKIRFNIDKKSWDNLETFKKKLTEIKSVMSGMSTSFKVEVINKNIAKVTDATAKAENKIVAVKEKVAKKQRTRDKMNAHVQERNYRKTIEKEHAIALQMNEALRKKQEKAVQSTRTKNTSSNRRIQSKSGVGLEFGKATGGDRTYADWWKQALIEKEMMGKYHQQALDMNDKFNRDKQRQADKAAKDARTKAERIAKEDARFKARGGKFDEGVEAFKVVKHQQLTSTAKMRGWKDHEIDAARAKLDASINQWRGQANGSIGMFRAQVNTVMRDLQVTDAVTRRSAVSFKSLRQELVQLTAAYTAFSVAQNVAQTGFEFESLRASARVFAKDDAGVADHMAFISEQAQRLGIDLQTATKEFTKFSIATQSSMTKNQQRDLFVGMSEYSRVLGLNKQDYERAFRAVQQIECCLPIQ
jgi:hypothetical protein